jgi:YggT family protein
MNALIYIILTALDIYYYVIIFYVIMSLLINFNVINTYNQFVGTVWDFLEKICEPVLRPIRNFLPAMGGIDLSPLVVLVALQALKILIAVDIAPRLGAY